MEPNDPVEVELLPGAGQADNADEQQGAKRGRPSRTGGIIVAAVLGLIGLTVLATGGPDDAANPPTSSTLAPTSSTVPDALPATGGLVGNSRVEVLPDRQPLVGPVALAPDAEGLPAGRFVSPPRQPVVWIVAADRVFQETSPGATEVALTPDGLVHVDDGPIVITSQERGGREDVATGGGRFWFDHHTGRIWSVAFERGRVASLSWFSLDDDERHVTTLEVEAELNRPVLLGGSADAPLLLYLSGTLTAWGPAIGTVPLSGISAEETFVPGFSGPLAAVAQLRERRLSIVHVPTDTLVAEIPTDNSVVAACFSPDGRHVALQHVLTPDDDPIEGLDDLGYLYAGSSAPETRQQITIVDLDQPDEAFELNVLRSYDSFAWTGPDELVVTTENALVAVKIPELTSRVYATLSGAEYWSITSASGGC